MVRYLSSAAVTVKSGMLIFLAFSTFSILKGQEHELKLSTPFLDSLIIDYYYDNYEHFSFIFNNYPVIAVRFNSIDSDTVSFKIFTQTQLIYLIQSRVKREVETISYFTLNDSIRCIIQAPIRGLLIPPTEGFLGFLREVYYDEYRYLFNELDESEKRPAIARGVSDVPGISYRAYGHPREYSMGNDFSFDYKFETIEKIFYKPSINRRVLYRYELNKKGEYKLTRRRRVR